MKNIFEGVCPVVNVPFFEDESIDFNGLNNVTDFALREGCNSICLFAFNSEPHKMSDAEKRETIA